MKNAMLLAAACAAVLSGCAIRPLGPAGEVFNPENPKVHVIAGKQIVVDQEPIFVTRKDAPIVWELPRDRGLAFPADGIAIKDGGEEFVKCGVERDATRFTCTFRNSKQGARYKYTIKVLVDGKEVVRPLDPWVFGDF